MSELILVVGSSHYCLQENNFSFVIYFYCSKYLAKFAWHSFSHDVLSSLSAIDNAIYILWSLYLYSLPSGGNAVLLYASKYNDVPIIVNISGRFALERGIDGRLGRNFMQRINKDGYIDVKNKKGICFLYVIWYSLFML
jgi:hypothetical protein